VSLIPKEPEDAFQHLMAAKVTIGFRRKDLGRSESQTPGVFKPHPEPLVEREDVVSVVQSRFANKRSATFAQIKRELRNYLTTRGNQKKCAVREDIQRSINYMKFVALGHSPEIDATSQASSHSFVAQSVCLSVNQSENIHIAAPKSRDCRVANDVYVKAF
jgi:hypothetical protein